MKSVPLGSQNTVEFTASLPFSQHNQKTMSIGIAPLADTPRYLASAMSASSNDVIIDSSQAVRSTSAT